MSDQSLDDRLAWLNFRFPRRNGRIRELFVSSAAFRALCEEYGEALRALRHWETAPEDGGDRVEEYRTLVAEIEAEIRDLLEPAARRYPSD